MGSFNKLAAALLLLLPVACMAGAGQPGDVAKPIRTVPASRVLSLGEICSSIRSALQSSGAPEAALPSIEQIRPSVPVMVAVADPGLQVLRMDADVVPGSLRVRLWTGKEPAIHPFDVRILAAGDLLQWLGKRESSARVVAVKPAQEMPAPRPPAQTLETKLPTLVFPGRTATLLLYAPGMEVRTPAMPLNSGVSGEWIRVRNLSTGQIIDAQVVGPGSLATHF
jgi:Chaperone for flagella basal body P-ring formation